MCNFENIKKELYKYIAEYEIFNGNSDEYNNGYIDAINDALTLLSKECGTTIWAAKEVVCGKCGNHMNGGFCEICGNMNNENDY